MRLRKIIYKPREGSRSGYATFQVISNSHNSHIHYVTTALQQAEKVKHTPAGHCTSKKFGNYCRINAPIRILSKIRYTCKWLLLSLQLKNSQENNIT